MGRALVFPGQGSQAVGMGREVADTFTTARQVFEELDDTLNQALSRLMFDGPAETLTLTENAQPALMAVSMALLRVLQTEGDFSVHRHARFVAGHSLGEYTALCAAGALSLADTARLLKLRGQAMQRAVPVGQGAMAALIGADLDQAREITAQAAGDQVCAPANDNAPGQIVISGHTEAIERALALAAERGLKRAVRLTVSAPFHCPLMQPAADVMAQALANVAVVEPVVPVVANVRAAPVMTPEDIRSALVEQVTGAVRWREGVAFMVGEAVTELVEVGAGKVLSGLSKRIDRSLAARSIQMPADIEDFLGSL